jgi:CheY-like chemotaxis protein
MTVSGDGSSGEAVDVDALVSVAAEHPANGSREERADRTTVLVVDDNTDVRAYVRSVLAPSYENHRSGERCGRARARAHGSPRLIVADVMMPVLDGLAMGRALKDDPMTDAIPVVLLTARAASEGPGCGTRDRSRCLRDQADSTPRCSRPRSRTSWRRDGGSGSGFARARSRLLRSSRRRVLSWSSDSVRWSRRT